MGLRRIMSCEVVCFSIVKVATGSANVRLFHSRNTGHRTVPGGNEPLFHILTKINPCATACYGNSNELFVKVDAYIELLFKSFNGS